MARRVGERGANGTRAERTENRPWRSREISALSETLHAHAGYDDSLNPRWVDQDAKNFARRVKFDGCRFSSDEARVAFPRGDRFESLRRGRARHHSATHSHTFPTMSATAAFFAVRAPVRVSVAQVRPRVPARPSRAPQIGFIDSRLDASRGCSRARKSDRRPPLLVPAKPPTIRRPSARPRAARPPRRPPSRRRTSSARSRATPPRRRTAPSWRWPRRSACTPSARWPRRARTARASKAALRRRLRLRLR